MFELRLQTYWADTDAAGIVYFSHFFRFVEQAEEELFRASGRDRQTVLTDCGIWMPRVEAFAKFENPIRNGMPIRVRLTPEMKGSKAIRYTFEIWDDPETTRLAHGHSTIVVVDQSTFRAVAVPDRVRDILGI